MSLFIASLNSGSNGNCYYVGNQQEAVLIDVGISCRETEKRMARLGLLMNKVKAIFVSHEHHDHIRGVPALSKKYQIPVYITKNTLNHGSLTLETHLTKTFERYQDILIGSLSVSAFPKFHDAIEPHSFTVRGNNVTIGVFTDIGTVCEQLKSQFKKCHAAFLEANYDEDMLERGKYPFHLKRRIRGGSGHLSNKQALEVFTKCKSSYMSLVLLSHLSKDNNCPILSKELFSHHAGNTKVVVASRFEESQVYQINGSPEIQIRPAKPVHRPSIQYSLFQ
ncbi:MAG TPA: MBL fold metallo-hydrolase [Pedobacter sp.]|jgi:phosphoribosyl 1,2-cyclic phosphodiesterase